MNFRSDQPEPVAHYGTFLITYELNEFEVIDDALGPTYDARLKKYGEYDPRFVEPRNGKVSLEIWMRADYTMPSETRIKELCDGIKKRLEKTNKYYNVKVQHCDDFEPMQNYE